MKELDAKVYGNLTYIELFRQIKAEPEWAASRLLFEASERGRLIEELAAERAIPESDSVVSLSQGKRLVCQLQAALQKRTAERDELRERLQDLLDSGLSVPGRNYGKSWSEYQVSDDAIAEAKAALSKFRREP